MEQTDEGGDEMSDISKVDSNFAVRTDFKKPDLKLYDVRELPFAIYGVQYENGRFRRLPEAVAKATSDGVYILHEHTAGGRVRFRTDSAYITLHANMPAVGKMPHFALSGSIGMDLYERVRDQEVFRHTFLPQFTIVDSLEGIFECGEGGMREYTLNLPTYSAVSELCIGLQAGAAVEAPTPYANALPIVYYGSSITQGACATRPGRSYESAIQRRFHVDYINLGFSGSAKGEDAMIAYLAGLPMSIFVCDYDYNAPSAAHLAATHEKLVQAVRAANPQLPIVLMTRPKVYLNENDQQCLRVIQTTFANAKAAGDNNIYLLTGAELLGEAGNEGTVEGVHPNDYGFACMAKTLGDLLETLL